MQRISRGAKLVSVVVLGGAVLLAAETRKEFHFTVSARPTISVTNQYGSVSVKPSTSNQVTVTAILRSVKVEVDKGQSGNRVDILSHLLDGANAENGRVDYELVVPSDASVILASSSGPLRAQGLHGDVTLEGANSDVDVREIKDAHVHVKTLNGPITLTNISDGHVEITSVSGNITLHAVSGPHVQINSNSGWIHYDGDFGYGGEYYLSSHSGDIDAIAPQDASIDVVARSVRGKVENDFPLQPKHTPFVVKAGSAFAGTMNRAASSVKLFSFSGKIHLKKR
jgi:DUF4097 and DUF4098 domain-containing protein YvlB